MFATDTELSLLSNAKTWYVNDTLHIVRQLFYQLFTVHIFVQQAKNMKQVPLVQVVMSHQQKRGQLAVIQAIKDILQRPPQVQCIVMDVEDAI